MFSGWLASPRRNARPRAGVARLALALALPLWLVIGWAFFGAGGWGTLGLVITVPAAFLTLRGVARASSVNREPLPGPAQPGDEHIALFRFDGALFFGAAERISEKVRTDHDARVVVLRLSQLRIIDATGANALAELVADLERSGVTVLVKGIQPQHERMLTRVGVLDNLRHEEHLFTDLDRAIAHARDHVAREAPPR